MPVHIDKSRWIFAKEAAGIVGTNIHGVAKLARRGLIRPIAVPGLRPRYSVEDCEQIIREALDATEADHDAPTAKAPLPKRSE